MSPQTTQQNVNLAGLSPPRPQTVNTIWPTWSGTDDPWNPLSYGSSSDGPTRSQIVGSANFQTSYQDYRSKPILSECDTNAEDSTYGSRLTHSIGNHSAYGEDLDPDIQTLDTPNPDTQLVYSNLESLQLTNESRQYRDQWSRSRPPASVATAPAGGERRLRCKDCQKICRTQSELRYTSNPYIV